MRLIRPLLLAAAALLLGAGLTASRAAAAVTHTVRPGETLTSIAAADGLTVAGLAAANGLSSSAELAAGAELVIPPQGAATTGATPAAPAATATATTGGYLVRPGDTLSAIAARLGTTPSALAAANGLSVNGLLLAGSTLSVSGVAADAPVAAAAPTATVVPTAERVSAADVGSIAAADGVPASLAEAIADQESGFNNAMVSSTGATGVMQIEPGTWDDLSRLDGLELSPGSATDNIRGGVAILHDLLDQTGGDETDAIAAYYQGLASVRAHGMLPGTRRYVRDVLALQSRFGG
jgi:N-acetylmuramoyl-L-alanine amidase